MEVENGQREREKGVVSLEREERERRERKESSLSKSPLTYSDNVLRHVGNLLSCEILTMW